MSDSQTRGGAELRTVGQSVPREDGPVKVTGRAEYTFDIEFPHMLWAAFVRSPHAHARIVEIDASEAEAMQGVHAVITQQDFPDVRFGDGVLDQTVLADEKVLFEG
ncbi:MAG: hypothetical protein R3324_20895, partial [Halobacteriales archaeon]|nr:hypothetical protein [Halobacteriales archaeon]